MREDNLLRRLSCHLRKETKVPDAYEEFSQHRFGACCVDSILREASSCMFIAHHMDFQSTEPSIERATSDSQQCSSIWSYRFSILISSTWDS